MIDNIRDAFLYENHSYEFLLLEEFLPEAQKRKARQGSTSKKHKGKGKDKGADDSGHSGTEDVTLSLHSAPDITSRRCLGRI